MKRTSLLGRCLLTFVMCLMGASQASGSNMMMNDDSFQFPECCTFVQNRFFAYFEKPDDLEYVYVWVDGYDENEERVDVTTFSLKKVGTAPNGHEVWQWVGPRISGVTVSEIAFGRYWFSFVNGGYYSVESDEPLGVADETMLPLEEVGNAITVPDGLITEEYTLVSRVINEGEYFDALNYGDDYIQTIHIGFDGSDVYLQGLCPSIPEAWVKGTMNDEKTKICFPSPQYFGSSTTASGETKEWYFSGYNYRNDSGPVDIIVSYNEEEGTLVLPVFTFMVVSSSLNLDDYTNIYAFVQIFRELPQDELVTPPNDLAIEDYTTDNSYCVKVGFYNDDVYIRGIYPGLPLSWIKGKLSGDEIVFPKGQYLGESDIISDQLGESETKKIYFSALNSDTYEWDDLVLTYDQDNQTMIGGNDGILLIHASRVAPIEVYSLYGIELCKIIEAAATPSAPQVYSFEKCSPESSDYSFTFEIPARDVDYNGIITDKLYYKIFTEVNQEVSEVSFRPADYETLQETLTLIPYDFSDGKYFCSQYNNYGLEKNVILKGTNYPSLNKIGVKSIYLGAGETNESEISWFTAEDAVYRLHREIIYHANYLYNDENRIWGKEALLNAINDAQLFIDNYYNLDEEALQSYNLLIILDALQALIDAEEEFTALNTLMENLANQELLAALYELNSEINNAYTIYNDEVMWYGKEELLSAIHNAENVIKELTLLAPDAINSYDVNIVLNAIQALRDAEKMVSNDIRNVLELLSSEISKAYDLYWDWDMMYGKDELMEAINVAESLMEELYNLDEEELLAYDVYIIRNAIKKLKDAEEDYIRRNNQANYIYELMDQLSSEISKAYDLYYDYDMIYGKEELLAAIHEAESLREEFYNLDEEARQYYDAYIIRDAIQALKDSETEYVNVNTTIKIDEEEWLVLKEYYQSVDSYTWNKCWDFSSPSASKLPGVTATDGHITHIDLEGNNIFGPFPYSFLTLPYLEELNLSDNRLTGDIGEGMTSLLQTVGYLSSSIRTLNMSYNQLTGNVSILANALPNLNYLYASNNRFEEVNPVISSTVTELGLNGQTISQVVDINIQDLSNGIIPDNIPNILLYNHYQQSYDSFLNLNIFNGSGYKMTLGFGDGLYNISGNKYVYQGESGNLIYTTTYNNSYTVSDCTLPARLYFDEGDANFNGQIDILDLQTQINYMFDDYFNVFNFTAANLWKDDRINVQDAVCMVNMLLDRNEVTGSSSRMSKVLQKNNTNNEGQIFISDGKLFVNTSSEISAFDIVISTNEGITLSSELTNYGITCSVRRENGQAHVIGYSLNGGSLPKGLIQLGEGLDGEVVYAMFSDKDAHEIPVSLNLIPTNMSELFSDTNTSDAKYKIPLGRNHALIIDANGKKTIHQVTK